MTVPPALPAETGGSGNFSGLQDFVDVVGPIAGTGLVGIFLLMFIFRIKVMPTYVYDEAKLAWAASSTRAEAAWDAERQRLTSENIELKQGLKEANLVYTQQVIPTLTRVLDAERELVDLRRDEAAERRRRGTGPD